MLGAKDNPIIIHTNKILDKPKVQFNNNKIDRVEWEERNLVGNWESTVQKILVTFFATTDSNYDDTNESTIAWVGDNPEYNPIGIEIIRNIVSPTWQRCNVKLSFAFDKRVDTSRFFLQKTGVWNIYKDGLLDRRASSNTTVLVSDSSTIEKGDYRIVCWSIADDVFRDRSPLGNYYRMQIEYSLRAKFYDEKVEKKSLGEGNKVYALPGSELLSSDTTITIGGVTKTIGEYHAQNILDKYKNGRQTINNMTCFITKEGYYFAKDFAGGNYENDLNNPANRTYKTLSGSTEESNITIEIGDIVCPMRLIRKAYTPYTYIDSFGIKNEIAMWTNIEEPISKYADGKPRVFEVTSSEIERSGGMHRQHLKMREVT